MAECSLASRLVAGERRALARAITLVESTRNDHREQAAELLDTVLGHTGKATRLGISGPPGAGKSTFIQAYGRHLIDAGERVAVLAIDPSSTQSGGSILGDKTRMPLLAAEPDAFIRPSPAGRSLGGVARRTREVMLLCEAAGFTQVLIETVGVGQSETAVAGVVDTMLLLQPPGAGDDLQGIKRGVMELADVVAVTKADGSLLTAARTAAADARQGLALLRRRHPGWTPQVVLTSSLEGEGIAEVADAVAAHRAHLDVHGLLQPLRRQQARSALHQEVHETLLERFLQEPAAARALRQAERDVEEGRRTPPSAARFVLEAGSTGL